jgi:hypothetical protein
MADDDVEVDVQWPDPADDPEEEPVEDSEHHLLPNRGRLRQMTRAQRHELRDQVSDWIGETVERWRELVARVDAEEEAE